MLLEPSLSGTTATGITADVVLCPTSVVPPSRDTELAQRKGPGEF
jgi:hypothetical protein